MTGFLTNNVGWKLLSLAAALVLWFVVASEPELATLHSVPVEYKGVPDDLEISSNFVENVFLEMRGPAGRLRDLSDTRPAVVLDFSTVHEPGERTFTIDQSHAILPRGIQLVRAIPTQLRFRFERRISREVPVEVRLSAPHDGYAVASYEVIPSKLTVTGPQSSVQRTNAVVTDPVDIGGVISLGQFRVNTYLAEPQVRFQSSSHVTVRVVVKTK
jgi:YbbR domain-containing protein